MPNFEHAVPALVMGVIGGAAAMGMKALVRWKKTDHEKGYRTDPSMMVSRLAKWHAEEAEKLREQRRSVGVYPRSLEKQVATEMLATPERVGSVMVRPHNSVEEYLTSVDRMMVLPTMQYVSWISRVAVNTKALEEVYPRLTFATEAVLLDKFGDRNPLASSRVALSYYTERAFTYHTLKERQLRELSRLAHARKASVEARMHDYVVRNVLPSRQFFEDCALAELWDMPVEGVSARPVKLMGADVEHYRVRGMMDYFNTLNGNLIRFTSMGTVVAERFIRMREKLGRRTAAALTDAEREASAEAEETTRAVSQVVRDATQQSLAPSH